MDDYTVYLFVRQDLSEQDQKIQLCHAVFKMAALLRHGLIDLKMVELDGGLTQKAFDRTRRRLNEKHLQAIEYSDSDHPEWGITAIATAPLSKEQALPLENYRLRRSSPLAQGQSVVAAVTDSGKDGGSYPSGRANCCVSSEKEHPDSSREVAGSIPAHSSNSEKS